MVKASRLNLPLLEAERGTRRTPPLRLLAVAILIIGFAPSIALGASVEGLGTPDPPPAATPPVTPPDPAPAAPTAPSTPVGPAPSAAPSRPAPDPDLGSSPAPARVADAARATELAAERERRRSAAAAAAALLARKKAAQRASNRRIGRAKNSLADTLSRVSPAIVAATRADAVPEGPPHSTERSSLTIIGVASAGVALLLAFVAGWKGLRRRRRDHWRPMQTRVARPARDAVLWTLAASVIGVAVALVVLGEVGRLI